MLVAKTAILLGSGDIRRDPDLPVGGNCWLGQAGETVWRRKRSRGLGVAVDDLRPAPLTDSKPPTASAPMRLSAMLPPPDDAEAAVLLAVPPNNFIKPESLTVGKYQFWGLAGRPREFISPSSAMKSKWREFHFPVLARFHMLRVATLLLLLTGWLNDNQINKRGIRP